MEKILEQTLLYDFYGELLTEHQRHIFEEVVLNDLSLSEAAEEHGISRQGVHDLVRRCGQTLEGYEAKLHLVARFLDTKKKMNRICRLAEDDTQDYKVRMEQIKEISREVLEEL